MIKESLCKVIVDRNIRPDVRAAAINCAGKHRNVLLAMCDVLDDTSPAYKKEYTPLFRSEYPFSDHVWVKTVGPLIEKQQKKDPDKSKTISELALAKLAKATKKDFGKDSKRWRKWIEANVK